MKSRKERRGSIVREEERVEAAFVAMKCVFPPHWKVILIAGPASDEGMEAHCFSDLSLEARDAILRQIVRVDSQKKRKLND